MPQAAENDTNPPYRGQVGGVWAILRTRHKRVGHAPRVKSDIGACFPLDARGVAHAVKQGQARKENLNDHQDERFACCNAAMFCRHSIANNITGNRFSGSTANSHAAIPAATGMLI